MALALVIEKLHKSFSIGFIPKKSKILKGISLKVESGEIFGYLGPNGAGKTTTLKCLLGIIFPEKGKMEIFGHPSLSVKAKEKIGYLPENPYFYDHLTASELLYFYSRFHPLSKLKIEEKIDALLGLVGLEKASHLRLRKFSRGMLQRIGIAQALLNDPSLVLLDEPLGGLDPLGRKEIRDIIMRLREEGKTVFLSSHILQDIEMVCDRVAILVNGKISNQGKLQDLISEKILYTEIILSGLEEKDLKDLGENLKTQGNKIFVQVFKEEKVGDVLQIVRSKNGKILSLTPKTESLEDLFVGTVRQT